MAKIEAVGASAVGAQNPHPTVSLDRDTVEAISASLADLLGEQRTLAEVRSVRLDRLPFGPL